MRAKAAAKVLLNQGYTVRTLKPGYDDLVKAGFKKGKDEKPERATSDEDSRKRNAG
jgi:hypothetical protein